MDQRYRNYLICVRLRTVFRYACPPLPEQRAIAEALSDVDALIERLDALIAKKRAVKTATMQRLLTGEQRLPGFDGAWETRRLGEVSLGFRLAGDFSLLSIWGRGYFPWVHIRSNSSSVKNRELKPGQIGTTMGLIQRATLMQ